MTDERLDLNDEICPVPRATLKHLLTRVSNCLRRYAFSHMFKLFFAALALIPHLVKLEPRGSLVGLKLESGTGNDELIAMPAQADGASLRPFGSMSPIHLRNQPAESTLQLGP